MTRQTYSCSFESAWSDASSVLFDFDGVLADSEPLFRRSWNAALEPWGHSISEKDYWKYWSSLGEGLEGEIRRKNLGNINLSLARERQRKIYETYVNDGLVPLFPLTRDLLELLSSRGSESGIQFCIASNTPYDLIRKILLNGNAPVPLIVGGDGLRKKPCPDIFLRAASLLHSSPSATIVFEDSWKGVAAADSGGFVSVLVINRYNRELDIESKYVIDGIKTIMDLISRGGTT